jgi:hypothetical protein
VFNYKYEGGENMPVGTKQTTFVIISILFILFILVGCFIYPPEIRYSSYLVPKITSSDPAYSIDAEAGYFMYDLGGSTIQVKYLTEKDLNALFPEISNQGEYSTNPYTHGNWIDPNVGYTPNRFTVFEVGIINRSFAKMKLDPIEAVLLTDLGEEYHSYTTSIAAGKYGNSFENYYKSVRGESGNENYRYEMRLGSVRGKNYGIDETIFRGNTYSGLIAFDPMKPEVKRVKLILKDVVYRFDAFNRPADVITIEFDFNRKIEKVVVTREMRLKELEREKVKIVMSGPRQIVGNRINDSARNARAIDKALETTVPQMEKCFMEKYRRGELTPGSLVLSFTIEPNGVISSQNVIEVISMSNESFMNCILGAVKKMKLEPIQDLPAEGENIVKGPAKPVNVTYPLTFSVYMQE